MGFKEQCAWLPPVRAVRSWSAIGMCVVPHKAAAWLGLSLAAMPSMDRSVWACESSKDAMILLPIPRFCSDQRTSRASLSAGATLEHGSQLTQLPLIA